MTTECSNPCSCCTSKRTCHSESHCYRQLSVDSNTATNQPRCLYSRFEHRPPPPASQYRKTTLPNTHPTGPPTLNLPPSLPAPLPILTAIGNCQAIRKLPPTHQGVYIFDSNTDPPPPAP